MIVEVNDLAYVLLLLFCFKFLISGSIILKLLHGWREVEVAEREEGIQALGRFDYHAKASFYQAPT